MARHSAGSTTPRAISRCVRSAPPSSNGNPTESDKWFRAWDITLSQSGVETLTRAIGFSDPSSPEEWCGLSQHRNGRVRNEIRVNATVTIPLRCANPTIGGLESNYGALSSNFCRHAEWPLALSEAGTMAPIGISDSTHRVGQSGPRRQFTAVAWRGCFGANACWPGSPQPGARR